MVRPQNFLFFNRIAKTGSSSIIVLIKKLKLKLNYVDFTITPKEEYVFDSYDGQVKMTENILSINAPAVCTRHYAFLDFHQFGYNWMPDYFNVVRDPIEKVISNIYKFHILIFIDIIVYTMTS